MSQENVEIVRRILERFINSGEIAWETMDPLLEVFDHDVPDAGKYRGHEGFGQWLVVEREDALVYRLRDGLTVQLDYFNNRRDALEAAGLPDEGTSQES
jgi:hypothetical protein